MNDDYVTIANMGSVPYNEHCEECVSPMFYRVNEKGEVNWKFCGTTFCPMFLKEIEWKPTST